MPGRARRLYGCLIKAPLGCAAFLVGALAVTILLMPTACGPGIARSIEEDFARAHRGTLIIGHASVPGVLEPQELRGVVLVDPLGREVLRGSVALPALLDVVRAGPAEALADTRVTLSSVDLLHGRDGGSNLRAALAAREGVEHAEGVRIAMDGEQLELQLGSTSSPLVLSGDSAVSLQVSIDHLAWAADDGTSGARLLLRDVRGRPRLAPADTGARLSGKLEGRVVGEAGGHAELYLELADLGAFLAGEPGAPARLDWRLRHVDARAVEGLLGLPGLLAADLAGGVDELVLESRRDERGERVSVRLRCDAGSLVVAGRLGPAGELLGAEEDELVLTLRHGSPWAVRFLTPLLPFMAEFEPDATRQGGDVEVRARDFRLTRAGVAEGRFEVVLGPGTWRFPAAWRGHAAGVGLSLEGRRAAPVRALLVSVDGGRTRWSDLALAPGPGAPVVTGELDHARGELSLQLSFGAPAEGAPAGATLRVSGSVAAPTIAPSPVEGGEGGEGGAGRAPAATGGER